MKRYHLISIILLLMTVAIVSCNEDINKTQSLSDREVKAIESQIDDYRYSQLRAEQIGDDEIVQLVERFGAVATSQYLKNIGQTKTLAELDRIIVNRGMSAQ